MQELAGRGFEVGGADGDGGGGEDDFGRMDGQVVADGGEGYGVGGGEGDVGFGGEGGWLEGDGIVVWGRGGCHRENIQAQGKELRSVGLLQ